MPQPHAAPKNRALCQCGSRRTVSIRCRSWPDINGSRDDNEHPDGWRCTMTLKCAVCNERTCHYLREFLYDGRPDYEHCDIAETRQHLRPGSALP